ncbi:MAG: hypothetical protein SOW21_00550 [[Actinobacillus] rossii]|nr:hypothetical protein [[Actinobacillus] rossii]
MKQKQINPITHHTIIAKNIACHGVKADEIKDNDTCSLIHHNHQKETTMNKYEALGRYTKTKEMVEYLLEEMNNYARLCEKPEFRITEIPITSNVILAQNIHCNSSQKGKPTQQSDG